MGKMAQGQVPPTASASHTRRNLIAIIVVIVIAFLVVALLAFGGGSSSPLAPKTVTVSGTVSASGEGTYATEVQFTDSFGVTHSVQVSGGSFTIALANPGAYSIVVEWSGAYSWQGGSVTVSNPLNLNVGAGGSSSIPESISISTPDSDISISGSAHTNGFTTYPVGIAFTSANGGQYSAAVSTPAGTSTGTYSISLPNDQTYSVTISGKGALGYSGSCSAGSLTVDEGPGFSSGQAPYYAC